MTFRQGEVKEKGPGEIQSDAGPGRDCGRPPPPSALGDDAQVAEQDVLGGQPYLPLLFGVLVGAAAGAFYAPMMAIVSAWFERNRSLAVSLVSAGMGMAPITVAPFARWLISTYEWRPAMMVIGIVAWILLVPASFLIRRAPVRAVAPPVLGVATPVAAMAGGEITMTVGEAFRTPQFAALALAHFACCAAHSR